MEACLVERFLQCAELPAGPTHPGCQQSVATVSEHPVCADNGGCHLADGVGRQFEKELIEDRLRVQGVEESQIRASTAD
jgi:hypothetical protein